MFYVVILARPVVLGEWSSRKFSTAKRGGNKQLLTFDYQFSLIVLDSAEMAQFRSGSFERGLY